MATGNHDFLSYVAVGDGRWASPRRRKALPAAAAAPMDRRAEPAFYPTPQHLADAEVWDRITRSFDPVMGTAHDETRPEPGSLARRAGNRSTRVRWRVPSGLIGALTYSHKKTSYETAKRPGPTVTEPEAPWAPAPVRTTRGRTTS